MFFSCQMKQIFVKSNYRLLREVNLFDEEPTDLIVKPLRFSFHFDISLFIYYNFLTLEFDLSFSDFM